MSFNTLNHYVCLNIVTDYDALQSCHLRELSKHASITLLKDYVHPNEQPVVFMP